jgi:uroporphyrinogen III methyltransferase / synthase
VTGTVYLVGAGPGDPGLLTVRGAELIRRADVVVYDRLVSGALLDLTPPWAELVYAGKAPGEAALDQEEINAVLVERATLGKDVVRLKGGDPFVFGRGGEEALACARAGVPFQVVPGVSSAVAAPAFAGIPVTHRGLATSFAVITASGAAGADPDLSSAASGVDTLVILMAVGKLEHVCRSLIEAGRPADEPAAVVQWATTSQQRTVTGTLSDLAARAVAAGIRNPAAMITGRVVALADELSWFDPRPLLAAAAGTPAAEETRWSQRR